MDFWKNKNVFITGVNGFVGSHLTESLIEKKANITALIKEEIPNSYIILSKTIDKVNVVRGSLVDYELIKKTVDENNIEVCFHLGAQAIVTIANKKPLPTFESNIKGTWNLLEACRLSKTIKRIVIASSDKAYGDQEKLPYTEESPLLGLHPYDASKACTDILARTYFHSYNLPLAVVRCGNIYGPGDLNFSRIIPDTIRSLLKNQEPIIRSDGTPKRDYIYIKDVSNAYILLAKNLHREDVLGEAFNFGNNNPISVLDLVNKIIKISGKDLKPKILGKGVLKGEIKNQYLAIEKARKVLNFEPAYSLEHGLKITWEWYKEHLMG